MTEAAQVVLNSDLLEWPEKDNRRLLRVEYRVGDLDRTIEFYTEYLGMKLLRKGDFPEEKYSKALLGFGPEESHFVVELTYNYGVTSHDIGTGFGHFAIATQDIHKMFEAIRAKGAIIIQEPFAVEVEGRTVFYAFVKDPDGYMFELVQKGPTRDPFCQVSLHVGDLDCAIKFYEKAIGMKQFRKVDLPEIKMTVVLLRYGNESDTTALELAYKYGVTEYSKGNGYARVTIGTDDVYRSAEVVNLVTQELRGEITRQPGSISGISTKITSFLDPDGWEVVLVDNEDFLKELQKDIH